MITDKQGNTLPGATHESAGLFDRAVEAFNIYRGDPFALLDAALDITPDFTMARVFKAHLLALATEPDATQKASKLIADLKSNKLSEREISHVAALELLVKGHWSKAAEALDRHNIDYPKDLIALQSGHLMDFYRANGRNLRDRIARVLPYWSADTPGYSILLGMYAFGLEETGDYGRAEENGRHAIALEPFDCWAHHAVTHVMEMQGRPEDGIGWMVAREPFWSGDDNFFKVHNWWHHCLFHLDIGQTEKVLELYDTTIREGQSTMALDLVDASALLWRLELSAIDVGDRWRELASAWDAHMEGSTYPFNDWHAVMAYLGAGRDSDVNRIISALSHSTLGPAETDGWAVRNALPLINGFAAFRRGEYRSATEHLYSARHIVNSFGGSHAQRDIIDLTLTEAAIRGNQHHLAQALINERVNLKPHGGGNLRLLSRCRNEATAKIKAA